MSESFINKEALYQSVEMSMHHNPHRDGKSRVIHNNEHLHFMAMILNTPNADVRPVIHAHWKVGGIQPWNGVVGNWVCSNCGRVSLDPTEYCGRCGATMENPDDEEEDVDE